MPWTSLLAFLSRDYWQRLWIIQELALNHNMTLFLCGEHYLSRGMIRRACEFCMRKSASIDRILPRNPHEQNDSFKQSLSIWNTVYQVDALITMPCQASEGPTLDVMLDLSRRARVTNTRDTVYGLLGLFPDALAERIPPGYALSQDQVYAQFVIAMLNASKTLDPIFSWCTFRAEASTNSWILDWTWKFTRNHIQWLRIQARVPLFQLLGLFPTTAANCRVLDL